MLEHFKNNTIGTFYKETDLRLSSCNIENLHKVSNKATVLQHINPSELINLCFFKVLGFSSRQFIHATLYDCFC